MDLLSKRTKQTVLNSAAVARNKLDLVKIISTLLVSYIAWYFSHSVVHSISFSPYFHKTLQ